ncbi:MAG: ABC transporter ATP-binding protein, partial [Planctomycetota bacterium]
IKKIVTDVSHLVSGILLTGSQLVCEVVLTGAITLLLLYLQPLATAGTILVVGLLYGGVYFSRRSYIARLGKERLEIDRERFRTFVDIISGIKSIQSYGVQDWFTKRHEQLSATYAELQPKVAFISTLPRYFVEALAYSSVVLTTLYLVISGQDFLQVLPMLILFALAGHRIIPSLNGIYNCLAKVLEAYPAIGYIYDDLYSAIAQPIEPKGLATLQERITLDNVCFRYETNEDLVLDQVSLTFTRGSKIGIVGPSGSGKSTLIEILMGLLEPTEGTVSIDATQLDATTRHSWRRQTGFVPQDVFLYDDTVARNVAFGCNEVDLNWVQECCKIAQVHDFIQSQLPEGYCTKLGEQGIRLSGGQRQRIGLARALYGRPEILLLDEATSALDSVTERNLVSAIYEYFPALTIVMIAHRISTVEQCEVLYVLDRGRMVGSGTYSSLVESSELFRGLASFSN